MTTALVQRRDYLAGQRRTIIARSLLGSLAGAVPIPFLDDWAIAKIVGGGYKSLAEGAKVTFEQREGTKGVEAYDVSVVSAVSAS